MQLPVTVHMDHVSAVTCVDYSPTGREFVCGSYDKTIRIFETHKVIKNMCLINQSYGQFHFMSHF